MAVSSVLPEVAARYGITVKTVTRRIKEHPELGIVVEPKRAPRLDSNQVQALCAILDKEYGRRVRTASPEDVRAVRTEVDFTAVSQENARLSQRVLDLEAKNTQLKTDIEVEKARRAGLEDQLALVLELNQRIPRLEEAAEERRREAADLREEVSAMRAETAKKEADMRIEAAEQVMAAREEWKSKGFLDRVFRR